MLHFAISRFVVHICFRLLFFCSCSTLLAASPDQTIVLLSTVSSVQVLMRKCICVTKCNLLSSFLWVDSECEHAKSINIILVRWHIISLLCVIYFLHLEISKIVHILLHTELKMRILSAFFFQLVLLSRRSSIVSKRVKRTPIKRINIFQVYTTRLCR